VILWTSFFRARNASRVGASVPAYGTGFTGLSLHIAVSVCRPTDHSVTIWTYFLVLLMLAVWITGYLLRHWFLHVSLPLSLHTAVPLDRPTYLSVTIWSSFFVPLMVIM